jgi:hypothetical protein
MLQLCDTNSAVNIIILAEAPTGHALAGGNSISLCQYLSWPEVPWHSSCWQMKLRTASGKQLEA